MLNPIKLYFIRCLVQKALEVWSSGSSANLEMKNTNIHKDLCFRTRNVTLIFPSKSFLILNSVTFIAIEWPGGPKCFCSIHAIERKTVESELCFLSHHPNSQRASTNAHIQKVLAFEANNIRGAIIPPYRNSESDTIVNRHPWISQKHFS